MVFGQYRPFTGTSVASRGLPRVKAPEIYHRLVLATLCNVDWEPQPSLSCGVLGPSAFSLERTHESNGFALRGGWRMRGQHPESHVVYSTQNEMLLTVA